MKEDSFWDQPVGEVFRKDMHLPEFMSKDIKFGKKEVEYAPRMAACPFCGKDTPTTVSTCLACGAPAEAESEQEFPKRIQPKSAGSGSFIDMAEELL